MKRLLFFSSMTLIVVLRAEPQDGIYDTTSNVKSVRNSGTGGTGAGSRAGKLSDTAIGVFHGKLKELTKNEIVIENESKQIVSMRCSQKTQFLRNNEPIRPTDIELDTSITVEAIEKRSSSLVALNVSIDTSATKANHFSKRSE
jgi:hypothetical protein